MTTAMKKTAILIGTVLLLTGCFHDMHELRPSEWGGRPVGYIATALSWELADDAGTPIHALTLSPGGAAASFTKSYSGARDAAKELIQLPAGAYDVLATVNMTEADGFTLAGLPATRAFPADVAVSLKNPVSSPAQAWFGVAPANVEKDAVTSVQPQLQRLLCSLSIKVDNVPAGATLVLTLSNVAKSVTLTARDAGGRYGVPGAESVSDLTLATLTAQSSGPVALEGFTVLPTASAFDRCILSISVTSASGVPLSCVCDAPHMEAGKAYTLNLDYNSLQPYMYLDSYSISEWESGWTVNGEILNPDE